MKHAECEWVNSFTQETTPIVKVRESCQTWEIEYPTSEEVVYWPIARGHWQEDPSQEGREIWEANDLNDHEEVYLPTA